MALNMIEIEKRKRDISPEREQIGVNQDMRRGNINQVEMNTNGRQNMSQAEIGQQNPGMQMNRVQSMGVVNPIPDGHAVRTGEAEKAYNAGMRMGAESLTGRNGKTPETEYASKRISRAEEILMRYKAGKSSVDKRIIAAQEWWKLRNWREINGERGYTGAQERKSNTAWLWNAIVGKHADAMDSYPEPVILPRMQDDKEEASRLSDIVPVVMDLNGFEDTYSQCMWQKMLEGTAGYGIFWDGNKLNGLGDISIKKVNLLNLFWEPGVTEIQDSSNLFFVRLENNDQLEARYPQLQGKLKNSALVVAKYIFDDNVSNADKSAVVDWYYKRTVNGKQVVHFLKFVGDTILASTEDTDPMKGLYDDGQYPFVLDPLFPVEGVPAGYGYIDIGKDAQTDIDLLNQALVLNTVVNATPRYFIRGDGAVNEDEFAEIGKPLIHVNGNLGDDSIKPVENIQANGNALSMLQQKIEELKFVTGNSDVNNGSTPSGVTAASAIAALKEDSGRSSKDSTKAAYRAYSKIVTMVIERIRQFYDIPRQFRILGQRGQEEFVSYSNAGIVPQPIQGGMGMEDGMRMPAFDIQVRAQRENAYTKVSQNELAIQFFQLGFFNPQMTDQSLMAIDMMDFKGKDEIQMKIQQMGTMQQAMMQMSQIALALAQKYEPGIADQLSTSVQSITGQQIGPVGQGNAQAVGQATGGAEADDKPMDDGEGSTVIKMKQRMAATTRPN